MHVLCFVCRFVVFACDIISLYSLNVTRSDKRGTKSLRRSRDNWRKHHLGVIPSIFYFFDIFTLYGVYSIMLLQLTVHFDQEGTIKHISKNTKAYFDYSHVNPFRSIFSKWPLFMHACNVSCSELY